MFLWNMLPSLQNFRTIAPSFEFEEVELIIREELGHSIEELFDHFDDKTTCVCVYRAGTSGKHQKVVMRLS